MHRFISILVLFIATLALYGCSSTPSQMPVVEPAVLGRASERRDENSIRQGFYRQYQQWRGTQYAFGGTSKRGMDCSGLVFVIFQDEFGVAVPRTTLAQAKVGFEVSRGNLQAGDLVFFKTGAKAHHVGIYLEDEKFLHVSTKKGVIISAMDDYYWRDKFWQSRRIELR